MFLVTIKRGLSKVSPLRPQFDFCELVLEMIGHKK